MKAALLCNGPSRSLFTSTNGYNYLIGCNVPWRQVDATVVLDVGVVQKWWKDKLPLFPICIAKTPAAPFALLSRYVS